MRISSLGAYSYRALTSGCAPACTTASTAACTAASTAAFTSARSTDEAKRRWGAVIAFLEKVTPRNESASSKIADCKWATRGANAHQSGSVRKFDALNEYFYLCTTSRNSISHMLVRRNAAILAILGLTAADTLLKSTSMQKTASHLPRPS